MFHVQGEIKDHNTRLQVILAVCNTKKGWSQRFVQFARNDEQRAEPTAATHLNVEYVSDESFRQLKQWWQCDLKNFSVYDWQCDLKKKFSVHDCDEGDEWVLVN